ncbi:type 4a pilus biogenesis protein PilO [Moritella viscosa]|uniref:Type IV pilus biogenesis protein PilO n=1 Tax=Moritella viscosa TaxID=80854 RepID=A0A090IND6_9GAMM|nr:type 4a pilus biogenesis protein PilO [Moritella viscosa]CED62014.1 fimbrial assembly protein PilO [Moritella viscosa]SGY91866.1 Putative Type IV pilus biogenesis protein PilO [Moritella viscosa]SGY96219.1 Putative Type IV pilus biogenesis protein PilO [Moritella viscosa]SGY96631.1 Putative Type IV pilus biogenesis protein PilO [Moritella viscosa]SGZ01779.1 Putative Type IV pilus biogenesis protein PilO [Moritella viscosa]
MNLQELNELDLEDLGNWPKPAKIAINIIFSVLIAALFYWVFISTSLQTLDKIEKKEASLRLQFEAKASLAGNLGLYTAQMSEMENLFNSMLRQLPSKSETAGLLDDLSYIGQHNGLQLRKFKWLQEVKRDFSYEVPVNLEVIGTFHQLGQFTSDIAALPRIVTLEDFTITKLQGELLKVNMIARTYRYKGDK